MAPNTERHQSERHYFDPSILTFDKGQQVADHRDDEIDEEVAKEPAKRDDSRRVEECHLSKGSSSCSSICRDSASMEETAKEEPTVKNATCPFNKEYSKREYVYVVCAGLALAFNSGYINGACLSGLMTLQRQSVAGFTGAYTASALSLSDGNFDFFGFQTCMILSFMAGSTITGALSPRAQPWRIAPTYGPTFIVGGLLLLASTLIAILADSTETNERLLFYFAAAANGVQNGISSMYSSNLIRTCHLTGTSTDVGLLVGQYLRGNRHQVWKLRILVGLALSFWLGGIISFYVTQAFTSHSLLFNSVLFLCIGISLVIFLVKSLGISVWQAVRGTWSWEEALNKLNLITKDGEPVSHKDMMTVFDRIDDDGNGVIEESELMTALKGAGFLSVSKSKVRSLMSVADENGDGLISRNEWRQLVEGHSIRNSKS